MKNIFTATRKAILFNTNEMLWEKRGKDNFKQGVFEPQILKKKQDFGQQKMTHSRMLSHFSRVCDPVDGSPPGSPVPGILQARTLEWVAISFSNA